mmetsp:Transcript_42064/g.112132  ORF Transcript_42064/g.112132 Transcript_42064/m.112132 type:complete len:938 (+) Transcript_42064:283-3096(+)
MARCLARSALATAAAMSIGVSWFGADALSQINIASLSASNLAIGEELDAHVQLTVDLINNKTDGWYDELLPGIELVVHKNDSQCDTVRGALAFTSLTSMVPDLAGIIGPTCSGSGSSIAPLAGLKRIPTISGSATATPLAEENPFFMRTIVSNARFALLVSALTNHFDWEQVNVLYEDNTYSDDIVTYFKHYFRNCTLYDGPSPCPNTIVTLQSLEPDADEEDVRTALQQIKKGRSSIVVTCVYEELFTKIEKERGAILGDSDHVWISFEQAVWASMEKVPRGALALDIHYREESMSFKRYLSNYGNNYYNGDDSQWRKHSSYSSLTHDAVMAMAIALNKTLVETDASPETIHNYGAVVRDNILASNFDYEKGAFSGMVRFDANGNREQNLTLWNYNGTDWVTAGLVMPDQSFTIDATQITWPDGEAHDHWSDTIEKESNNRTTYVELILAIAGSVSAVLVAIVIFVAFRNKKLNQENAVLKRKRMSMIQRMQLTEKELSTVKKVLDDQSNNRSEWLKQVRVEENEVAIKTRIGMGSYAEVFLGQYRGAQVAVKKLKKLNEETLFYFRSEVCLMMQLRHPNVIMLIGACWSANYVALLLEYMSNGSVDEILKSDEIACTWEDPLLKIAIDTARGMLYLHQSNYIDDQTGTETKCIVHRDLKPDNMLLTRTFGVKLTDFGLSRALDTDQSMTMVGTPLYTAPEIVSGEKYDEKIDVYSFGICLLAFLQLEKEVLQVFRSEYRRQYGTTHAPWGMICRALVGGMRPTIPDDVPKSLADLITWCWQVKPKKRPNFAQILEILDNNVRPELFPTRATSSKTMDNIATTFVENAVKRASGRGSIASPLAADIAKDQEKQKREREQERANTMKDREARTSSIPEEDERISGGGGAREGGGGSSVGDVEMQVATNENPIHSGASHSASSDARADLSQQSDRGQA